MPSVPSRRLSPRRDTRAIYSEPATAQQSGSEAKELSRMKSVPPTFFLNIRHLVHGHPEPQNVALFGDRFYADVIS